MEQTGSHDPHDFVAAVKPLLEARDMHGLLAYLKSHYSAAEIVSLLKSRCCDTRKIAALSLSLVGCHHCLPELIRQLKDADPMVAQMAEHAVWSIWFRQGPKDANCAVHRGVQASERRDWDEALAQFTRAIEIAPDFAEAWNQRATVHYLNERYEQSIRDAAHAVQLNPDHFGAWAGIGHCHAHLGRFDEAISAYQKALSIHPRLECLEEAIGTMRERKRQHD